MIPFPYDKFQNIFFIIIIIRESSHSRFFLFYLLYFIHFPFFWILIGTFTVSLRQCHPLSKNFLTFPDTRRILQTVRNHNI